MTVDHLASQGRKDYRDTTARTAGLGSRDRLDPQAREVQWDREASTGFQVTAAVADPLYLVVCVHCMPSGARGSTGAAGPPGKRGAVGPRGFRGKTAVGSQGVDAAALSEFYGEVRGVVRRASDAKFVAGATVRLMADKKVPARVLWYAQHLELLQFDQVIRRYAPSSPKPTADSQYPPPVVTTSSQYRTFLPWQEWTSQSPLRFSTAALPGFFC